MSALDANCMETISSFNDFSSPFLVLLMVLLSALSVLCALSCSWVAGRKKRQRVGNNEDANGLVMQMPKTLSRSKLKTPDRYSVEVEHQLVILPIDDIGQSLAVPTIVVTPPSPLGVLAEVTSIQSNSSIGSANDLIYDNDSGDGDDDRKAGRVDDVWGEEFSSSKYSDGGILHQEGGILIRGHFVRDSMRNKFGDDSSSVTPSGKGSHVSRSLKSASKSRSSKRSTRNNGTSSSASIGDRSSVTKSAEVSTTTNGSQPIDTVAASTKSKTATANCEKATDNTVQIHKRVSGLKTDVSLAVNGNGGDSYDDDDDDDFFSAENCAARPRLSSIEPGSRRPSITQSTADQVTA